MEQHLRKRDKAVLASLAALLVMGSLVAIIWHLSHRADNAFTAMARGQYKLAAKYYEEEIAAGSPQAMTQLANLHYLGLGTQRNHKAAAQLYLDASAKGYAAAQLNLGHLYRQGIGVPQDALRAFGWYSMSDVNGSPWAEPYLRQTAVEFTLTPNQISSVKEKWPTLAALVEEGL